MRTGYVFHEGELPSDYRFIFPVAVFNTVAYRLMQTAAGWFSFYILEPKTLSVHGHIHFHVAGALAVTPLRAPFGSAEISPAVSLNLLRDFFEFAEFRLARVGVSKIVIKNPPDAYIPETAERFHTLLMDMKYRVKSEEVSSIIFVSPVPFGDLVHPRKRRKLQQSKSARFSFLQLDRNSLAEVYEFISVCRISKKYKLSITFDDLQKTIDQFPKEYHIFAVYQQEKLMAASIAIKVNDKVLYHFISDHLRGTGAFSPALILMEGIYNFCDQHHLQMLDLGTSQLPDGRPDSRLLNFKKELGAHPAPRFIFMKTLV